MRFARSAHGKHTLSAFCSLSRLSEGNRQDKAQSTDCEQARLCAMSRHRLRRISVLQGGEEKKVAVEKLLGVFAAHRFRTDLLENLLIVRREVEESSFGTLQERFAVLFGSRIEEKQDHEGGDCRRYPDVLPRHNK